MSGRWFILVIYNQTIEFVHLFNVVYGKNLNIVLKLLRAINIFILLSNWTFTPKCVLFVLFVPGFC